jgi:subtilisin family serine protease
VSHPDSPAGSRALNTYGVPGSGGRQPIAYVGPAPARRSADAFAGRRPVVAILDTGCAAHPWLDTVVDSTVRLDGVTIGYSDPTTDPETNGDQTGPLDGEIDPLAGHGTFIAGLVHQGCPDADILSWRVVPSSGPLVESDWIAALAQIAELVRRYRAGEAGGRAIDVLSLSMGYYHETPEDVLFDPTLYAILEELSRLGTLVVCSAGNDATSRPSFPAAFAPWSDGAGPVGVDGSVLPIVSVGALNPNLATEALFSNTGPWVRTYVPGAAVMSTHPPFQGGYEPVARTEAFGRWRSSIDPDDYRGGFAVWSGTSFAAPLFAGRVAAALVGSLPDASEVEEADVAVRRAWDIVERKTSIRT